MLNDDPKAAINSQPELTQSGRTAAHSRWIAYNKLRGQTASALEHAVPEQFWVDKSLCRYADETGAIKNPTQADCAQAVSAVKAIAIAQQQGQRIYTITPENAATALLKLPIGGTVGEEVRAAVQAGKEVTIHESPITAHGWTGYGYTIIDPDTGAGAYLIEGRGNGAWILGAIAGALGVLGLALIPIIFTATFAGLFALIALMFIVTALIMLASIFQNMSDEEKACFRGGVMTVVTVAGFPMIKVSSFIAHAFFAIGFIPNVLEVPDVNSLQKCW